MSSFVAGAEMMTFLAPPLSMWTFALAASVKRPVDSMTMSIPRSFQGRLPGSFSAKTFTRAPSTLSASPSPPPADVPGVVAKDRVVLQKGRRGWRIRDVVDRDDLQVAPAAGRTVDIAP